MALLEIRHVKKIYTTRFGGNQVTALRDVNFAVEDGEYVAIMGESGAGKTTLLNILAALDKPSSGEVLLDGHDITQISDKELSAFRRDHLGFVFQDFNLLDTFSLRDNIYLPLVLAGTALPGNGERACCRWRSSWASPSCWKSTPMRSPAVRSSGRPWPGR